MKKANHFTVTLSTGKAVFFEFCGAIVSSSYDGTLTASEEAELLSIQSRLS